MYCLQILGLRCSSGTSSSLIFSSCPLPSFFPCTVPPRPSPSLKLLSVFFLSLPPVCVTSVIHLLHSITSFFCPSYFPVSIYFLFTCPSSSPLHPAPPLRQPPPFHSFQVSCDHPSFSLYFSRLTPLPSPTYLHPTQFLFVPPHPATPPSLHLSPSMPHFSPPRFFLVLSSPLLPAPSISLCTVLLLLHLIIPLRIPQPHPAPPLVPIPTRQTPRTPAFPSSPALHFCPHISITIQSPSPYPPFLQPFPPLYSCARLHHTHVHTLPGTHTYLLLLLVPRLDTVSVMQNLSLDSSSGNGLRRFHVYVPTMSGDNSLAFDGICNWISELG